MKWSRVYLKSKFETGDTPTVKILLILSIRVLIFRMIFILIFLVSLDILVTLDFQVTVV